METRSGQRVARIPTHTGSHDGFRPRIGPNRASRARWAACRPAAAGAATGYWKKPAATYPNGTPYCALTDLPPIRSTFSQLSPLIPHEPAV